MKDLLMDDSKAKQGLAKIFGVPELVPVNTLRCELSCSCGSIEADLQSNRELICRAVACIKMCPCRA